jgi:hypothetical protein
MRVLRSRRVSSDGEVTNAAKASRFAGAVDLHPFACLPETQWPESTVSEQAQELALILAGTAPQRLLLPVTFHKQVSLSSPGRRPQVTRHASPITSHEPRVTSHESGGTSR